jgi:thioredoxin-like negative regulator of GroEL
MSSSAQTTEAAVAETPARPQLLFFYDDRSGHSRRAEGFLAQVLQRRRNHETFTLRRFDYQEHADLAARLGVEQAPALVVVEAKRLRVRLERPRGCADIRATLAPWLK